LIGEGGDIDRELSGRRTGVDFRRSGQREAIGFAIGIGAAVADVTGNGRGDGLGRDRNLAPEADGQNAAADLRRNLVGRAQRKQQPSVALVGGARNRIRRRRLHSEQQSRQSENQKPGHD
jgi:hypothetical protein